MQLMQVVPGLKQMIGGLADLVSPDKIGGMFRAFSKSFTEFFQTLKSGGVASVKELVESLKKNFLDYLTAAGPGGQSFLNGLKDMWEAAKKIIVSAIDYLGDVLESGINLLTDILTGNFNAQASSIAGGIMGELSPIIEAFSKLFERLKEPALKLLETAFTFIADAVGGFLEKHWMKILGGYLSLAFIGAFATAFAQATGAAIMQAVIVPFLQKLAAQILGAAALNRAAAAAAEVGAGGAAAPFSLSAGSFAMMAVFMVAALAAVGLSIAAMRKYDVTTEEVIKAGIAVTAAGILMVTAGMAASSMAAVGAAAPALLSAIAGAFVMVPIVYGMMYIAGEIISLAAEARRKKVGVSEVMSILPVLGITAVLIFEAAAIAAVLMAIGSLVTGSGGAFAVAMAAGLATLALVVGAMIFTAGEIINRLATQNFDPAKVNAAVDVVEAVGNLFIKTIPVMSAIVAAIGLAAFGPLAVAGFGTLTKIVDKIVDTSIDVIERINKISVADASVLKAKIEPFVSIMKSIVEMINAIGGVLQSAGGGAISGIISSFTGKSPFDGAADLIENLIGNESDGTGIVGVLKVIKDSIEKLQAVPTATVAAFGTVIASVATLISSITGVIKSFSRTIKSEAFWGLAKEERDLPNTFADNAVSIKTFIRTLLPSAKSLIKTIKENVTGIKPEEAQSVAAVAGGLGTVLGAVGTLMGSLSGALGKFKKTTDEDEAAFVAVGMSKSVKKIEEFDSAGFERFMDAFTDKIKPLLGHVKDFMSGTFLSIKESIAGIDPKQFEGIKLIGEIIASVMGMATAMYSSLSKIDFGGVGGALSFATNQIVVNIPSAADMISSLAGAMPALVSSIGAAFDAFKPSPDFGKKVKSMKEAFEAVSMILKSIGEILPDIKDAAGAKIPEDTIAKNLMTKVWAMVHLLQTMVKPPTEMMIKAGQDKSPMAALSAAIDALPPGPKADSIQKLKAFAESMTTLKSIADVMKSFEGAGGAEVPTGGGGGGFQGVLAAFGRTVARGSIAMKIAAMKSMLDSIGGEQGFKTLDEPIKNAASAINITSVTMLKDIQTNLGTYVEGFKVIPDSITKMSDTFKSELLTSSVSGLNESLTNFETEINKLASTRPHQIQAKLKETLGSLGIKGATYKIDAKPIALNLQLNVVMSAGDVANGIANQSTIIRSRIEQLATRSGVQNYDITQTIPNPTQ
jgi:hypothetical protein